jgi:hypothetical protein
MTATVTTAAPSPAYTGARRAWLPRAAMAAATEAMAG